MRTHPRHELLHINVVAHPAVPTVRLNRRLGDSSFGWQGEPSLDLSGDSPAVSQQPYALDGRARDANLHDTRRHALDGVGTSAWMGRAGRLVGLKRVTDP